MGGTIRDNYSSMRNSVRVEIANRNACDVGSEHKRSLGHMRRLSYE